MLDHFLLCPDSNTFIGWLKKVSYIFHCEIESYEVISSKLMEIGRKLKWETITDSNVQRIYIMIITHSLITRYYELKMDDIHQILSWLNWDMAIFFESINPFNTIDLGILAGEILNISEKYGKSLINIDCTKFKHALLYASIHNDKAMEYYISHNMKNKARVFI